MSDRANRLRRARIAAGFVSASDAARRLGVSISTYSAHENGGRAYSAEDAAKYASRFGVTLDWLLTGRNGAGDMPSMPASPIKGIPVIGPLSPTAWEERGPIDLEQDFPQMLEVAILTGGPSALFFSATVTVDLPSIGAVAGDHLIAQRSPSYEPGDLVIAERTGFDGKLRQLRVMQYRLVRGESKLFEVIGVTATKPKPVEDSETRVLGRVEALHRSYR